MSAGPRGAAAADQGGDHRAVQAPDAAPPPCVRPLHRLPPLPPRPSRAAPLGHPRAAARGQGCARATNMRSTRTCHGMSGAASVPRTRYRATPCMLPRRARCAQRGAQCANGCGAPPWLQLCAGGGVTRSTSSAAPACACAGDRKNTEIRPRACRGWGRGPVVCCAAGCRETTVYSLRMVQPRLCFTAQRCTWAARSCWGAVGRPGVLQRLASGAARAPACAAACCCCPGPGGGWGEGSLPHGESVAAELR